ncbi:MAG TPA: PQQ-binding-like beta-propeller repeat protein [bacterium]|nr:PQQ-binding-like beta-propeller repeat protein [bacterium]
MHKKLFTAVLALGLLLLTSPSGFALDHPGQPGEPPIKAFGGSGSKTGTPILGASIADPVVTVNAGQNRTVPGTFCDGQYQGPLTYGISNWYFGSEFYAGYQDPQDPARFGAVCSNSPSFDVTAVNTIIGNTAGPFPFTIVMQPLVFAVASPSADPMCTQEPAPVAGGALCAGPSYSITWTGSGFFLINLPFTIECCQSGPYYAAWYSPTFGSGTIRIGTDGGSGAGHHAPGANYCSQWNEYGSGWLDMDQFWEANFGPGFDLTNLTWSEGYTPDDPATHCTPGNCATELYYDPNAAIDAAFGLPSGVGGGRDILGVRLSATGLDTLNAVTFAMNGGSIADKADLLLGIYANDGPPSPCGLPRPAFPGTLLYSEVIPEAAWSPGFFNTWALTTPFVWGTLNGGPVQHVFVTLQVVPGTGTTNGVLGSGPVTGCDPSYYRSIARFQPALNEWRYIGEVSASHRELLFEFDICREELPAVEVDCGAGGPDQWSQFAHDAQQTSASSINVGDPNQVTLSWTQPLPRVSNFTNPSVHNDIVYISSDQEVRAYNLNTGAFIAQLQGAPEMGSSNRGNTTVAYVNALGRDVVFATGGSFNAVSALETNLEASPTIWSKNPGNTPLIHQNRFNTSKVIDIAGTSVLIVCTEPAAGAGAIYALDAATGALYPGWATNPVMLDVGAKHGPAVSGGKLYVGTAIGGSNVAGSLYQIDAATGAIDWNFVGVPGEGWPSGVSVEGDFLYGATKDANNIGYRYKIDKSGVAPSVVWTSSQGTGLYGTPTIGRNFVYFPLDNPNFGILQVNKDLGLAARNFAAENLCGVSLFMVPQIVTLSCDAYLFAGDRNGRWWLFNAQDGGIEWYREFPFITGGEIINGTALATSSLGDSYAVVGIRQLLGLGGRISAYQLNAGSRPRLIQCLHEVTVEVPLNSGSGLTHSEADVFMNIGDQPLNFTALNIADPLPDGVAATIASRNARDFRNGVQAASANLDGYTSYAIDNPTKRQRLAGVTNELVDGEWSATEARMIAANEELLASSSSRDRARSMAAGANIVRTSNVLINGAPVPTSLAAGSNAGLDWTYDGTGLGRGLDDEILEIDMDDPDFNYDGSPTAFFTIHYVGGCADANKRLLFNTSDSTVAGHHLENVYNTGGLSDQHGDDLVWDGDPNDSETNLYDGGFILMADSLAGPAPDGGARIHAEFYDHTDLFVANPAPSTVCGVDKFADVLLGAYRTGGCPGTPVDIHGEILITGFADTNTAATAGTPKAAVGTNIVLTEVGSYDPLYGDFKLIHVAIENRDAVAKNIKFGEFMDWDVTADYNTNVGVASPALNGYFIWDQAAPGNAYGLLSVRQPSLYASVDPTANPLLAARIIDNPLTVYPGPFTNDLNFLYGYVNAQSGFTIEVASPADKSALSVESISLAPSGSAEHAMALFGIDASSNNAATIEAGALGLAKRAARWAGYARGDVNDDGLVDLADVCWLQGGNYIYPAAYSGDVDADGDNDAADIAKLLSFVSGNAGDQPVGAWRF